MKLAECDSCKAKIIWAKTVTGSRIPIDPEPVAGGKFWLVKGTSDVPFAINAGDHAEPARFDTHFATCPNADAHRKT